MRLIINGDEKSYPDALSLAELIEQLGMKGDRVAVELNREIVSRAQWPQTTPQRWRQAGDCPFRRRRPFCLTFFTESKHIRIIMLYAMKML